MFTSRKKNKMLIGSKEEYSAFEGANTPYCRPVHLDAEVQTDLTASGIEVKSMASSRGFIDKSKSSSRSPLIRNTDCAYFFN